MTESKTWKIKARIRNGAKAGPKRNQGFIFSFPGKNSQDSRRDTERLEVGDGKKNESCLLLSKFLITEIVEWCSDLKDDQNMKFWVTDELSSIYLVDIKPNIVVLKLFNVN